MSTDERVTPDWLYVALDAEFGFVLDVAATRENAKTKRYCALAAPPGWIDDDSYQGDGLAIDWAKACTPRIGESGLKRPNVWCNPPYSRGSILKWCAKAEAETSRGVTTAMLLPGDTSTEYFHQYVMRHEVRFVNRRKAIASLEVNYDDIIMQARSIAVELCLRDGETHSRAVREEMARRNLLRGGKEFWLGAVFRDPRFVPTGAQFCYSDSDRNIHERSVRVWRLA